MQVKKQQLELGMEQHEILVGSKLGKAYDKAVYCHTDNLTYMQSTSYEMPAWMNDKLIARRNFSNLRYLDDTILTAERQEELKNLLRGKRGE